VALTSQESRRARGNGRPCFRTPATTSIVAAWARVDVLMLVRNRSSVGRRTCASSLRKSKRTSLPTSTHRQAWLAQSPARRDAEQGSRSLARSRAVQVV